VASSIGNASALHQVKCLIRRVDRRSPVAPLRHFAGDLLEGVAGIDELGTTEVSKKNGPGDRSPKAVHDASVIDPTATVRCP